MKTRKASVHSRWSAAPTFVIALLMAGDLVLGRRSAPPCSGSD